MSLVECFHAYASDRACVCTPLHPMYMALLTPCLSAAHVYTPSCMHDVAWILGVAM